MSASSIDFSKFCSENTDGNFVEWLRQRNSTSWEAMIYHRFTQDVEQNTIPKHVFKKYLQLEHNFVRSAITIFAYALAKATVVDDQNRLIAILSALGNEQDDYFQKTFLSMGVGEKEQIEFKIEGKAKLLGDGAVKIAQAGSFLEILTIMLAAEWMYLTWCERASSGNMTGPVKQWVELHLTTDFRKQVSWLQKRTNELGTEAPSDLQELCAQHFKNMLNWEIAFHHFPYMNL